MLTFRVNDMSCGHCVSTITKAVEAADQGARLEVDLSRHLVRIQPVEADVRTLSEAIAEAGYAPVLVETREALASKAPRAGGCCCGAGAKRCG
ncbi:heavy-metal-associated domain-containing protein [Caldimonas tepidiphila]|uniref:heavy-metal-associated domain-containing protein n=1 Tax=Caldimonas tepidiphila TaxID=2315841 RepID=UPI000E5AB409|nr:heavy-metal-associated domain-containing protein [Caldimonas tepidiphila]